MTVTAIKQLTVPTPFAVGDAHIYLLEGETLSLIDAGVKTKEAWQALKAGLKEIGYYPNDIEQVILTHHHPDHNGLIEEFPRLKAVYGHPLNDVWLKRDESYFQRYEQFFADLYERSGVPESYKKFLKGLREPLRFAGAGALTGKLLEGDGLPGHEEFTVIETPGHAQSHLSFYRKLDGAFIGGDHLLAHISSNPLLEPPINPGEERPKPLLQYRDALLKCLDLEIHNVYPGHGPIFQEVPDLIASRLEKQKQRAEKVKEILHGKKEKTVFQVCEHLFPRHIDKEFGLTMSETIGQLDFLQEHNKIVMSNQNGVWEIRARIE
ncbi:MBL fold metallo-hydrolase [Sediminibacillus albus]|uniref:Glyoxylase, beta-lactamase superfamily II n=1 Tax=Sediminibacillus albus TaxID=407036 RepID=A0A1G8VL20_9BACI|nr:MBL fold metallo-hydrolase [Sediminibacillus albus]SDJ66055.1 Glyoxylase, beta-lactamase superfamily II [Sediminibacillus albus]